MANRDSTGELLHALLVRMATDSEASLFGRTALCCLGMLALYFFAYFPALSYVVRHPKSGILHAWAPLPLWVQSRMYYLWMEIDPQGSAKIGGMPTL